jgi:hypothetical protein
VTTKTVEERLRVLREAADVLEELRPQMPGYVPYIDIAMRRLRMIATLYEDQCNARKELANAERMLKELAASERKPPKQAKRDLWRIKTGDGARFYFGYWRDGLPVWVSERERGKVLTRAEVDEERVRFEAKRIFYLIEEAVDA